MKKKTRILTSLMGIVFLLTTLLSPLTALAQAETTNVVLTKLQAASFPNGATSHDGSIKTLDQLSAELGSSVTPLEGVTFTLYQLPSDYDTTQSAPTTVPAGATEITSVVTGVDGTARFDGLVDGKYYVAETGKPENVSSSLAVPFFLTLPLFSGDSSSDRLSEVYIYPKNTTGEEPTPGKNVGMLGNNQMGYDIGEEISWLLKGTIPTNIQDYGTYTFRDTLDSQLDYVGVDYVQVGSTRLIEGSDYTVTGGQNVEVSLTAEGIARIAQLVPVANRNNPDAAGIHDVAANSDAAPFIEVKLMTVINDSVINGKAIENNTTISFNNNPTNEGTPKETPPSNTPEVHTGGKKFIKQDATTKDPLAEAVFHIYDVVEGGEALTNAAGEIIEVTSVADGTFEVSGLAYGEAGQSAAAASSTYYLQEVTAPSGYVLLSDRIEFVVDATSYYQDPTAIELVSSNPQEVLNNFKPSIPDTGGIGSIIFMIIGLVVMVGAGYGYKRYAA